VHKPDYLLKGLPMALLVWGGGLLILVIFIQLVGLLSSKGRHRPQMAPDGSDGGVMPDAPPPAQTALGVPEIQTEEHFG
jgi:hypothetical protein